MSSYRFGPKGLITDNILEPLLNSLPDIIHSVDKEGKIVFTNKKASELLGYKHEELIGSEFSSHTFKYIGRYWRWDEASGAPGLSPYWRKKSRAAARESVSSGSQASPEQRVGEI